MSNRSQKNFQYVYIGAAANKTTANYPTSLNAGEIGCFTPQGVRLTEAAASAMATGDPFVIAMKPSNSDNTIVISPTLYKGTSFKKWNHQAYTAEQEQIDTIGYNGTTGSIDAQNLTEYLVSLSLQQNVTSNHGGWYTVDAAYTSSAAATEDEIASAIVESLVNTLRAEPDSTILVEMLSAAAGAAAGAANDTIVGSLGSRYIAITDGAADASVIALSAGDYIRLGTTVTDPVYKIESSTVGTGGGVLKLEWPLLEAVSLAGNAAEYITAAQAAAAAAGITLTGVQKKFSVGKLHNSKVSWKTSLGNWGSTDFDEVQKAHLGHGTERTVKELEWFTNGFDGEMYRSPEPFVFSQRALASGNYDTINLYCENTQVDVLGLNSTKFVITLMVPATAPNWAVTGTADDTTDVLEILVGATTGDFACA